MHRDIDLTPRPDPVFRTGRSVISVIGIDRYARWPRLANAVSDATATSRLFLRLGFEQVTPPLLDRAATGEAIRRIVIGDLAKLSCEDSLVLFFAGHGHTSTTQLGETPVKTGYLIPVDAASLDPHASATWLRLDTWLSDIARLPPRHILVVLDACHSGIALGPVYRWRDGEVSTLALEALRARRSRRVITSALDDQRAMDGGPVPGHSLFTGCLLEGLSLGLAVSGPRLATGSEIAQYVQRRVASYPRSAQTPDYGAFELDNRGDLVVSLGTQTPDAATPSSLGSPGAMPRTLRLWRARNLTIATCLLVIAVLIFVAVRTPEPARQVPPQPAPEPPIVAPSPPVDASLPPILDAVTAPEPSDADSAADDLVSGKLIVSGKTGWTTSIEGCRSGQINGFVGVDLLDASDELAVRIIVDPTKGKQVLVRLPKSDKALILTEDSCPGLAASVTATGDVYNNIRAVGGKVAFDCGFGDGARAKLNAHFQDCY
jgi:hypothetical protein